MNALLSLWRRLRFLLRRSAADAALGEEIAFHLEQRTTELIRSGYPAAEASARARREFGNPTALRQASREVWIGSALDLIGRDVRVAIRSMARSPGFSAAALATLALGIGGAVTVFALVHAALLAPLPYPEADRLVTLHVVAREDGATTARFPWSYPKFRTMAAQVPFVERLAGFNTTSANLRGDGVPERLVVEEVSAAYFEMLGARPALGRPFSAAEDSVPDRDAVAVLSHRLWRGRFGGDSAIVGRSITLGSRAFTVVGVMAPEFRSLSGPVDLWVPLAMVPTLEYAEILEEAGNHWLGVVARIRPGVGTAELDRAMASVGSAVATEYPGVGQAPWSASAAPLAELKADPTTGAAVVVLMAAVGLLLLIACANVAGLLLVRAVGRGRELAIRAAVGAGPNVIRRQLLVERLTLSLLGGALGVAAAGVASRALVSLSPPGGSAPGGLSYLFDPAVVSISQPVLWFALIITVATGLVVGLVPARRAVTRSVLAELRGEPAASVGSRPTRMQRGLVGFEAALALVLLIGAGLMIRSFVRLSSVDVGFDPNRVLTFRVNPADADVAARDPMGFKARVLAALRDLPGVDAAGVNTCAPLTGQCGSSVVVSAGSGRLEGPEIGVHVVDGGYFDALRMPLIAGRSFGPEDRPGSARVVIVNARAARRLWPGADPIGQRIAVATAYFAGGDSMATVVGVVGDVRYQAVEAPAAFDVYVPALQRSRGSTMFFVRTTGDPNALLPSVREAVRQADPGLPVYGVRQLADVAAAATARTRFLTVVLSVFSVLAVGLAVIGVYGVVAFAVRARGKEISIRLAIGAAPGGVVRLIVMEHLRPVVVGIVVGSVVAAALTRLVAALLYDVPPRDGATFGVAVLALAAAGLLACWWPARRAARADPVGALKGDG